MSKDWAVEHEHLNVSSYNFDLTTFPNFKKGFTEALEATHQLAKAIINNIEISVLWKDKHQLNTIWSSLPSSQLKFSKEHLIAWQKNTSNDNSNSNWLHANNLLFTNESKESDYCIFQICKDLTKQPVYLLIIIPDKTNIPPSDNVLTAVIKQIESQISTLAHLSYKELEFNNLNHTLKHLQNVIEASDSGIWEWNMRTGDLKINERWAEIIGYTKEELGELTIESWYRFTHPDDEKYSSEVFQKHIKGEIPFYDLNYRMRHRNGEWIWVNTRSKVSSWSEQGEPLMMSGSMTDINYFILSQLQLESYSNSIPAVVYRYILKPDGSSVLKFVSAGAYEIWGISPENAMHDNTFILEHVHPDDYESMMESVFQSQRYARQWEFTYRYIHPDGSIRWHKGKGKPHPLPDGSTAWDSLVIDITESEKLQQEILLQQKKTETLINSTNDLVWSIDKDLKISSFNSAFQERIKKYTGLTITQGLSIDELHFPEDIKQSFKSQFIKTLKGEVVNFIDKRIIDESGEEVFAAVSLYPIFDSNHQISGVACYVRDITELKRTQLKLEDYNLKYQALFEFSPQPMWVYDLETLQFLMVNKAAVEKYGYSKDEFMQMTIKDIRPVEELPKLMQAVDESRSHTKFEFTGIFRHQKKSGENFEVEIKSTILEFDGKKAELIAATDISERLNIIDKLMRQNESLRQIAWTQSHVVRAPLARMKGIADLLLNDTLDLDEIRNFLNLLSLSMEEFDEIIHKIIAMSSSYEENS